MEFRNLLQLIVRIKKKIVSYFRNRCSSKSFLIFKDSTCKFLKNMFLIKKHVYEE